MPRLLEEGDDFDAKDESGQTALRQAVFNGRDVMTLLLEKGANVHAEDDAGETALYWAATNGHEAVVQLLVEKRADGVAAGGDGGQHLRRRIAVKKGTDVRCKD